MSQATKRKHVSQEVLNDFPEPEGEQFIARVGAFDEQSTQLALKAAQIYFKDRMS